MHTIAFKGFRVLYVFSLATFAASAFSSTHPVGFLARNNEQPQQSEFQPTIDYLNKNFTNAQFVLVAVEFEKLEKIVSGKEVEFLVANPLNFVELEEKFGCRAIATLRRTTEKGSSTQFGGVVFCLAGQPANDYTDLLGKRIGAVSEESFGGMRMQMREINEAGISTSRFHIEFLGSHDRVIGKVISNECQFGFVRTTELEHYCRENQAALGKFRIISSPEGESRSFPYAVSTRLYPEWPFMSLAHADEFLISKVASVLLQMPAYTNQLFDSESLSWAPPVSYKAARQFTNRGVVHPSHYWSEAWTFGGLSTVFVAILLMAAERGRRRRHVTLRLQNFFPCVTACLTTKKAAIVVLLFIGSAERTGEALMRSQIEASYSTDLVFGILTFVFIALAMHAICGRTTRRGEILAHLEELLIGYRKQITSWALIQDFCRANDVTEEEFDSIETRILAAYQREGTAQLVDLNKHLNRWQDLNQNHIAVQVNEPEASR